MCAYVFLSEPPAVPRSIRRAAVEPVQEVSLKVSEVMECVAEVLTAFPDAYRAVMRRIEERWVREAPTRSP